MPVPTKVRIPYKCGHTAAAELSKIPAGKTTAGVHRSKTELARIVAAGLGWRVQLHCGSIHEPDGTTIAESIEALAHAGDELGWYIPQHSAVYWGAVHSHDPARSAREVREVLARENTTIVDDD